MPPVKLVVERVEPSRSRAATAAACCRDQRVEHGRLRRRRTAPAAPRTVSISSAVRTKRACSTARSEIGAHLGGALRPDGQEPELRQPPEGVAHRLARDPGGRATSTSESRVPGRQHQRHHLRGRARRTPGPPPIGDRTASKPDAADRAGHRTPSVDSDCILAY